MKKFLLCVIALLVSVVAMRHISLKYGVCTFCKTIYVLFSEPVDYYEPLAISELVQSSVGNAHSRVEFSPHYQGKHVLNLYPNKTRELFAEWSYSVTCTVQRYAKTKTGKLDQPVFSKFGRGATLIVFSVPDEFPADEKITCDVTADGDWSRSGTIVASKMSDL